ncbi:MAG: hypothetical protein KIIPBIDF_01300 [Candidatus Methanoperedenaceae archaeon GB50]|nr:MAG: hypothetical protein KIIPBIDF_01300 [Candidatus Methanoperedenaceae archaeon GB50]
MLSVAVFPASSWAVTVITFSPSCNEMLGMLQLSVPEAVPLPPRLFSQVMLVTPTLSEAVPPRVIELFWVE